MQMELCELRDAIDSIHGASDITAKGEPRHSADSGNRSKRQDVTGRHRCDEERFWRPVTFRTVELRRGRGAERRQSLAVKCNVAREARVGR